MDRTSTNAIDPLTPTSTALKGATASATARLSFPSSAAAAAPKHAQHTAGTAPLRPHGTADATLVQQAQATVLTASTAAALQAATARRRSGGKQQQQQLQQQPAAAAAAQPQQQARHQQAAQAQGLPRSVPISEGASSASAKADAAGAANHHHHQQQQQQQQRFRRCYYVPVMNPLPDLKDKQLAVLDMRLYGIRDMPSLQERLPTLPPSVLTTARLRGLPLFEVKDLVQELERSVLAAGGGQGQQTVLAAAEAFYVEEEDDEEEGEDEEEGPRLRTDSKSC